MVITYHILERVKRFNSSATSWWKNDRVAQNNFLQGEYSSIFALQEAGASNLVQTIRKRWSHSLKASIGLAMAVTILSVLSDHTNHLLLLAPFGSTGVILFLMPGSAFAKAHRVIGAHLLSATIGLLAITFAPMDWYSIGLVTGVALFSMTLLDLDHPPAGANPIVIMLLKPDWMFLVTPILAGSVALVGTAYLYNRLTHRNMH